MLDVKFYIVVGMLIAVLGASLRRPVIALLFFLVLLFIRPQDDRPNLADMHLPYIVAIALMALYAARAISLGRVFPASNLIAPMLVFFLLTTLSTLFGAAGLGFDEHFMEFCVAALTFFLILGLVRDEKELRMVIWVIFGCGLVFAYYALFKGSDCIATQDGIGCGRRNFAKLNLNFGQPNYLGLTMVIVLNLAYCIFLTYRQIAIRAVAVVAMATFVWVLILTGSRGAWLAFATVMVFHWWASRHKVRALLALGVLVTGAAVAAPEHFFDRIETFADVESDTSAMSRLELWEIGLDLVVSNPLFGVGIGGFTEFASNTPHNAYIQVAAEMGIPALIVWLWLVTRALRGVLGVRRTQIAGGDGFLRIAAGTMVATILAILVQGMTTGLAHREFVYIVLALASLIVTFQRQAIESAGQAFVSETPSAQPYSADARTE